MKLFNDRLVLEELAHETKYSVDALAEHFSVSSRQFRYAFEQEFGTTPKSWMKECRVRRALNLIEQGVPFDTIWRELHYSTLGHMRTEIKSLTGTTPNKINLYAKVNKVRLDKM